MSHEAGRHGNHFLPPQRCTEASWELNELAGNCRAVGSNPNAKASALIPQPCRTQSLPFPPHTVLKCKENRYPTVLCKETLLDSAPRTCMLWETKAGMPLCLGEWVRGWGQDRRDVGQGQDSKGAGIQQRGEITLISD